MAQSHTNRLGSRLEIRIHTKTEEKTRGQENELRGLIDGGPSHPCRHGVSHEFVDLMHAEPIPPRCELSLRQMVDALPIHIWSWTPDGEISYVNKGYLDSLGLTKTESVDFLKVALELVHPEDASGVQRTAAGHITKGDAFVVSYRRRGKDGSYRWMEDRCVPVRDRGGKIAQWYGVSIDIHDRVRAQEELRLAQQDLACSSRATSLAELSASIAHEVSQPLAAVITSSAVCNRWLTAHPPNIQRARKSVDRIARAANAAADVVDRIRALFRRSVEIRELVSISGLVAEARELMAEQASQRGIRLDVETEGVVGFVAADRVQIQQVLINIIRNGIEAMEATANDRVIRLRVRQLGGVVQTEISDSGPGIEFLDRIFEPFFSTKGHGMGMGLAICRSIIEAHGGQLRAENNEKHGATFISLYRSIDL